MSENVVGVGHRVDRVLGFFSSRPNWDPPPPHQQVSVSPPPLIPGGDTLACGKAGGGGPIRTIGQPLWYITVQCVHCRVGGVTHPPNFPLDFPADSLQKFKD